MVFVPNGKLGVHQPRPRQGYKKYMSARNVCTGERTQKRAQNFLQRSTAAAPAYTKAVYTQSRRFTSHVHRIVHRVVNFQERTSQDRVSRFSDELQLQLGDHIINIMSEIGVSAAAARRSGHRGLLSRRILYMIYNTQHIGAAQGHARGKQKPPSLYTGMYTDPTVNTRLHGRSSLTRGQSAQVAGNFRRKSSSSSKQRASGSSR